ncbi:MAG: alpha/beta fold hydrolase [Odoribacter sp.]
MELFYRKKGTSNLPPLIILHGLWGASDNWLTIAEFLSKRFYVILPDLRNHGRSPHLPFHNYDALAEDMEEFIETLHLPVRPFLAGHSMGGKTLMRLLIKRPNIAAKAAILDICPRSYHTEHTNEHIRLLNFANSVSFSQYQKREAITSLIRSEFPEEELYQTLLKNLKKTTQGYEWKVNTKIIQKELNSLMDWPFLPSQSVEYPPTLFIKGEHSDYIQASDYQLIRQFFPAAQIITLNGVSHRLHTDQPSLLIATLTDFFLPHECYSQTNRLV